MLTLAEVMKVIALPGEVKELLLQLEMVSNLKTTLSAEKMEEYIEKLTEENKWEEAWKMEKKPYPIIFLRGWENPETLPENTTLQRNAKQYLLMGGKIGGGKGILKSSYEKCTKHNANL